MQVSNTKELFFYQKNDELFKWVENYNGHVDHGAFIEACDEIAIAACKAMNRNVANCLLGNGLVTLEYAYSMFGFGPVWKTVLDRYNTLPGYYLVFPQELEHADLDW